MDKEKIEVLLRERNVPEHQIAEAVEITLERLEKKGDLSEAIEFTMRWIGLANNY